MNPTYVIIITSIILLLGTTLLIAFPEINQSLFYTINHFAGYADTIVWLNITHFGDGLLIACIAMTLLAKCRTNLACAIIASLLLSLLIQVLKQQFHILRPPFVLDASWFHLLVADLKPGDFSLPSGHTAGAFALATMAWVTKQNRTLCIIMLILAIMVGLSRIIVGVHWPADILAGAMVGIWSILLLFKYLPRLLKNLGIVSTAILYLFCAASAIVLLLNGTRLSEYTSISIVNWLVGLTTLTSIVVHAYAHIKELHQNRLENLLK